MKKKTNKGQDLFVYDKKSKIAGIVWSGVVVGFLVGLWAHMLYEHAVLIGVLSAFLFYILYICFWYLLVYRKKKKSS